MASQGLDDDAGALLAAARGRGAQRLDPVRFRVIEAMARRAASHEGEARRLLDARVCALLEAYGGGDEADASAASAPKDPRTQWREAGALAGLVDHIARHAAPAGEDATATPTAQVLQYFRSTWTRLSAERRLTQSLATVPHNAGPLNSHQLVHRSLALMRELSPAYLHRFLSHVDTLLWLDQANAASGAAAARTDSPRKTARGKSSR